MADRGNIQAKLNQGIQAVRDGDKVTARRLIQQVIAAEPNNEIAWMWLASAVDDPADRRACLERALKINPNNTRAQEALRRIDLQAAAGGTGGSAGRATPTPTLAPRPPAAQRPGVNIYLVLAAVVFVVLVGAIFVAVTSTPQPPSPGDVQEALNETAVALNASPLPTDVVTLTPTRFTGAIVTRDPASAPELPPTFTPTFTPTPSITPTPSDTPIPPSAFQIIYSAFPPGSGVAELSRQQADGSGDTGLSADDFQDIAVSPDGSQIAFVRSGTSAAAAAAPSADATEDAGSAGGGSAPQLWVAPINDLGAARQLTQLDGSILASPTWSPDGTQLAFTSNAEGDEDIWVIGIGGGFPDNITFNPGDDRDPAWSPDGSRIAYASDADSPGVNGLPGTTEIFVMLTTGTDPVRLSDGEGSSYAPVWTPDGRAIVFVSDRSGDSDLYIMDNTGSGENLITFDDGEAEDRAPSVSPDGRLIAFVSNRDSLAFQLYIVDVRGELVTRIMDDERNVQSVAFAPAA